MKSFLTRLLGLSSLAALIGCNVTGVPAAPPADQAAAVKGNNAFALELYAKLRAQEGNLFFSPSSISTALAMTYAGARGETAREMAAALHFTLEPEKLHPALGALVRRLNSSGKDHGYQLSVANALWAQQGFHFLPDYLKLVRQSYGAGLHEADFAHAAEQARRTINAWVEKVTRGKIKDLIPRDLITSDTRLVLTNAIYFKGDWARRFKKEWTREGPFQVNGQTKVEAPLMRQSDKFGYFDGKTFQALELPYQGKDLSLVVFLPKKADGLADFERTLTPDNLSRWLPRLREQEVDVTLPRFQVTAEFSLKDTLSALGMPLAFSDKADFSGMDGHRDLFLSAVVHKAFVNVNEEGTEAAAATAVVVTRAAVRITPVFRADHPFVFLIRDRSSGSILFMGRLVNPRP